MNEKYLFVCGNGNLSFEEFYKYYVCKIENVYNEFNFIIGDFRGTDTLMMEYLKDKTENVEVCHLFIKPRYYPDKFKTQTSKWKITGGFQSNEERDRYMIKNCTHYLAFDKNSDKARISGTQKNITLCRNLNKISINDI